MKIHIVQKGDTLWKIAKKYGVNFEELKQMNTQLSNPDMIMPGMKIKVPTTGGTIKKEAPISGGKEAKINWGSKKEMPKKEQPIIKEKPKEEQVPLPIEESPEEIAPIMEEPKPAPKPKPVPKPAPKPIVQEKPKPAPKPAPKPTMQEKPKPAPKPMPAPKPIAEAPKLKPLPKEEAVKETPKQPFTPKMPQTMIPEADFSQYYTQNMANMAPPNQQMPMQVSPQLPPKATNIFPGIKQETIMPGYNTTGMEDESSSIIPINQGGFQDSMIPYPHQFPMSPFLQGPGYPVQPQMPFPQQVQGAQMPGNPLPGVESPESSPYGQTPNMPNMPNMPQQAVQGVENMPAQMPAYQTAPAMDYPCPPMYPISPVLPGSGICPPYGYQQPMMPQVQGTMDMQMPHGMMPQVQGAMDMQMPHGMMPQVQGAMDMQMPHGMMPQVQGAMDMQMPLMPQVQGVEDYDSPDMNMNMNMPMMPQQAAPIKNDCGCGSQPGFAPQPGFGPQPGFAPQPGFGPQPGFAPQQGFAPQPGFDPQMGYGPMAGFDPAQQVTGDPYGMPRDDDDESNEY